VKKSPLAVLGVFLLGACATTQHGRISNLTAESRANTHLCAHHVPADVCTRCHPDLAAKFKGIGDWCAEHDVPESQCLECHPDLTFEPLPELPPGADFALISSAGEDVPDLTSHVAPGKVTVFDFFADWCAPCRNTEIHLRKMLGARTDLAVRKLNLVSWESPLAQRYLRDAAGLPYLVVYDRRGEHLRTLTGSDTDTLTATIDEAAGR
jgi:thiol-disulfide isomerase/thioredoxin